MILLIRRGTKVPHWLSQSRARGAERHTWSIRDDVKRLANLGFDHLRIPIDTERMWDEAGRQDAKAFDLLESALDWCATAGLRPVVNLQLLRTHHSGLLMTNGDSAPFLPVLLGGML